MQIRWTPFGEIARLQGDLDRLFGGNGVVKAWNPHFDVTEDTAQIVLEADVPGVKQEQLDIQIENNVLTVKGERNPARTFSRTFKLPETVDAEKISAQLRDGVLKLTLPKRAEAQPRQIKVSVQS
jgi:HSP20 family protein